MKRAGSLLTVSMSCILATSCLGGKDKKKEVSFLFQDESVENFVFSVNDEIVATAPRWSDFFLIPSAFAAVNRTINCTQPEKVSFEMDVLGESVSIESNCNPTLERNLRVGMLSSMAGKVLLKDYGGGYDRLEAQDYEILDLSGVNSNTLFGSPILVPLPDGCTEKLTFNKGLGEVTIELGMSKTDTNYYQCLNGEADESNNYCGVGRELNETERGQSHCTPEQFKKVLNFRFKDGFLEFDPADRPRDFSDDVVRNPDYTNPTHLQKNMKLLDYGRFCVAAQDEQSCDSSLYLNYESLRLPSLPKSVTDKE